MGACRLDILPVVQSLLTQLACLGYDIFKASLIILYKIVCRTASPCECKMGLGNKTCKTNFSMSDKI